MLSEKNSDYIGKQLKALTAIASPTGFTKRAAQYLVKELETIGYEPCVSNKGNVSVTIGGEGNSTCSCSPCGHAWSDGPFYKR